MAGKRILLAEGPDDEFVLKNLCGTRGVPELNEITGVGGATKLLENFPLRVKASEEGDIFGIVIDADTDIGSRWNSLRNRLSQLGYQGIPSTPDSHGTIIDPLPNSAPARVGIWLMPNNQTDGILEDFLRLLVPQESVLFEHVKSTVSHIPELERRFKMSDEPKAIIHTWLAWQENPGRPYGVAIMARYLDPNVGQVDVLVDWLNRLFFQ